jgi:hypothetical protein
MIARERDRKSLAALLATPLSATERVLGTVGASLLRCANALAAVAPRITLIAVVRGIEPRLILLAGVALASTALVLTARAAARMLPIKLSAGVPARWRSPSDQWT